MDLLSTHQWINVTRDRADILRQHGYRVQGRVNDSKPGPPTFRYFVETGVFNVLCIADACAHKGVSADGSTIPPLEYTKATRQRDKHVKQACLTARRKWLWEACSANLRWLGGHPEQLDALTSMYRLLGSDKTAELLRTML